MSIVTNAIRVTSVAELNEAALSRLAVVFPNSAIARGELKSVFESAAGSLEHNNCVIKREGNAVTVFMEDILGNSLASTSIESMTAADDLATRGSRVEVSAMNDALDRLKQQIIYSQLDIEELHDYFISIEDVRTMFSHDPEQTRMAIVRLEEDPVTKALTIAYGVSAETFTAKKEKVDELCGKDMSLRITLVLNVPKLQRSSY